MSWLYKHYCNKHRDACILSDHVFLWMYTQKWHCKGSYSKLYSFDKQIHFWYIFAIHISIKKFLHVLWKSIHSHNQKANLCSDFFHHWLCVMIYENFCVWLLLLNIIPMIYNHVIWINDTPFLLLISIPLYDYIIILKAHSHTDIHLVVFGFGF